MDGCKAKKLTASQITFFFFYLNKFIPDREFDTVNAKQKFQIHHYNHLKSKYLLD